MKLLSRGSGTDPVALTEIVDYGPIHSKACFAGLNVRVSSVRCWPWQTALRCSPGSWRGPRWEWIIENPDSGEWTQAPLATAASRSRLAALRAAKRAVFELRRETA